MSVGTRFLNSFADYDNLRGADREDVRAIANVGRNGDDPGEDGVSWALHVLGIPVEFSVSALEMNDPAGRTNHIGKDFWIQARLFERHSPWLRSFFIRVKTALRAAMERQQKTLVIAVYCKSGRHRSVAAVDMLTRVLQNSGCVVREPTHACDFWWRWIGCNKVSGRACQQCTSVVDSRKAALYEKVGALWHESQ